MRKPTEKQKKFVQGKIAGKSSRKAAIEAGYALSVADNANREITEHLGTQEAFNSLEEAYRKEGINEELLAKIDFKMLFATRQTMTGETVDDNTAINNAINRVINIFTRKKQEDENKSPTTNIQIINFNGASKKDES